MLSSVQWNFNWQRHQSLAQAAANAGFDVTFVEPLPRSVSHVASGLKKLYRSKVDRTFRKADRNSGHRLTQPAAKGVTVISGLRFLLNMRKQERVDLVIFYVPSTSTKVIVRRMGPRVSVYDDVMDWRNVPTNWFPPRSIEKTERWIEAEGSIGRLAVVSDSAHSVRNWKLRGVKAGYVQPAADLPFLRHRWTVSQSTNRLGYFGSVRREEIDVGLLISLNNSPDTSVTIVGQCEAEVKSLLELNRVRVMDPVPNDALPRVVDGWDAILLPYKIGSRTETLVPAKIWNCLSTGKVVLVAGLRIDETFREYAVSSPIDGFSAYQVSGGVCPTWDDRFREIERATGC